MLFVVCFTLVVVCLAAIGIWLALPRKESFTQSSPSSNDTTRTPDGICYFDIDGTLTTAQGIPERMVDECLDNNYAVGIVTASTRIPPDVCRGDEPVQPWMPANLCRYMNQRGFDTFNSLPPDHNYQYNSELGIFKSQRMEKGQKLFNIKDPKKVILFDNDPEILQGIKEHGRGYTGVCAGAECSRGQKKLNLNIVQSAIDRTR